MRRKLKAASRDYLALALLLFAFLFLSPCAEAQVSLSPYPKLFFTTTAGAPASGYELFTYAAGSTTKQNTYTDSTGATPNANPIILDTLGSANVWLSPGVNYKFVLAPPGSSDPPSSPVWTVNNIPGGGIPVITPQMYGAICNGSTANAAVDTAGLQAAITAALSTGFPTISSGGICALNSSISIINFPQGFRFSLGGVIAGPSFPTKSSWTSATPFFLIGASGGTQVGLNIDIGYANGAISNSVQANVVKITGAGLSSSRINVGYAPFVNGVIDIESITGVASDNLFTGNLWSGCTSPTSSPTNPNACGNFGVYSNPGVSGGGAQGNIISTNFIENFNMGGVIENNDTLFTKYSGGLEQNGGWTSQLCLTGLSGTFQSGETVTEGAVSGTLETPVYGWRNSTNCAQVIETRNSSYYSGVSHTNFSTSGTLTGSTSGATGTISSITVVNQLYGVSPFDPESFDIVSAHSDTQMDDIVTTAYTGGIVGPLLATSDLLYKNGSTFTTCLRGLGVHTTGSTDELTNCLNNPSTVIFKATSSGVQLGGYDTASGAGAATAQTLSVQSVGAGNANQSAPTFTIQGALSNGSGTGGNVAICTTATGAGSGNQNTCSTALTVQGATQSVVFTPSAGNFGIGITRQGGIASLVGTSDFVLDGTNAGSGTLGLNHYSTGAVDIAVGGGTVQFGSGAFSANGSVATTLGSVGPVGSHTTVQEWFTIKDSGGTTRYIPGF